MKLQKKIALLLAVWVLTGLAACGRIENFYHEFVQKSDTDTQERSAFQAPNQNGNVKQEETPCVSLEKYAYQNLGESTRRVYDQVYDTMIKHKEKAVVSALDKEELNQAYRAVMADYGGIFWVSGYAYTEYTIGSVRVELEFAPKYTMSDTEREQMQAQVDAAVEEILLPLEGEISDDYKKAKYVFDYLASNVEYRVEAENNQNILSVFLGKATVCQGYACAAAYLLERLGIQSVIISGTANGETHAWNLIRLDGDYYYMDVTWGNSSYFGEEIGTEKYVNYSYFGVTSEELERTHTAKEDFPLPECVAVKDNYYVREGRYFADWNPEKVGALLQQTYENGECIVSVKFAGEELYQKGISYFIGERHIMDYCSSISSLYYLQDDSQNVLTIKFSR